MASNIDGIIIPPRGTPAPNWAVDFNASFIAIDSHDHSPGNGAILSFDVVQFIDNFKCTLILDVNQYNFIANPNESSKCSVFCDGDELFCIDGFGKQIKITSQGKLNLTYVSGGGFSGDYVASAAKVVYSSINNSYTFLGAGGATASTVVCNSIVNTKILTFAATNSINELTISSPTPSLTIPTSSVVQHTVVQRNGVGSVGDLAQYIPLGNGGGTTLLSNLNLFYSSSGPVVPFQYYSIFLRGPSTTPTGALDILEFKNRESVNATIPKLSQFYYEPAYLGGISQSAPLVQTSSTHKDMLLKYSDNLTTYSNSESPNFWTNSAVFAIRYVGPI